MTTAACLAWFSEPRATLERCVLSLGGVCDYLVALDGRWDCFPAAGSLSSLGETVTIKEAAAAAGLDLELVRPRTPFKSQVAKRSELMSLGRLTGADWLLVLDADEYLLRTGDREAIDEALALTESDVAQVMCRHTGRGVRQRSRPIRRLYRASTHPIVATAHNGYRTEDGRWLHGDPAYVTLEQPLDLSDLLTIEHDVDARPSERRLASRQYRMERRRQRLEVWT